MININILTKNFGKIIFSLSKINNLLISRNSNLVGGSEKRGLLYVVINSIVANIWKWSRCYALIEPDEEEELENNINAPLLKDNE